MKKITRCHIVDMSTELAHVNSLTDSCFIYNPLNRAISKTYHWKISTQFKSLQWNVAITNSVYNKEGNKDWCKVIYSVLRIHAWAHGEIMPFTQLEGVLSYEILQIWQTLKICIKANKSFSLIRSIRCWKTILCEDASI